MKKGLVVVVIALIAIAAGGYWLNRPPTPSAPQIGAETNSPPETQTDQNADDSMARHMPPADQSTPQPSATTPELELVKPPLPPPPKDFCERDFTDLPAREADAPDLQAAGGLVHIFEREAQLADPYGCADFYLQHGLDIDAVDPRADHEKLTGLFFAIQRNDPKMVHFMIDHDADLEKRAGKNDTRALGYAYFLALNDTRINRNQVIGILDGALTKRAAEQSDTSAQ